MVMETKLRKSLKTPEFPVVFLNIKMAKGAHGWAPAIGKDKLQEKTLKCLIFKKARLTGDEIHFIRSCLGMTLQKFAERFYVSHPAVMKWERSKSKPTDMNWTTEKDIRLFVFTKLDHDPKRFCDTYDALGCPFPKVTEVLRIDLGGKVS